MVNNINSGHQLQLMGAVLGASYTLGNNVSLSGVQNIFDVWGTNIYNSSSSTTDYGFLPIGIRPTILPVILTVIIIRLIHSLSTARILAVSDSLVTPAAALLVT